jgi:2-dehydro-3-deoxyphosphooctonate aldolase (KDO 8-P synthase)
MEVRVTEDLSVGTRDLFFIAGPCAIESEQLVLDVAGELARWSQSEGAPLIFKSSFDKANRSSVRSFRGPGLDEGLRILSNVREETGLPLLSDVHEVAQVGPAARVLDVLQVPAFLCRQTDLLLAAGESGRAVNIKKGQFLSPAEMENPLSKVQSTGNRKVLLTERGFCFGYNNLVADMRSIPELRRLGAPVVFDATHSVQLPGGGRDRSSGRAEFIPHLAAAAVAAGCDGVFLEVHPSPKDALCDGDNSLPLSSFFELAGRLRELHRSTAWNR